MHLPWTNSKARTGEKTVLGDALKGCRRYVGLRLVAVGIAGCSLDAVEGFPIAMVEAFTEKLLAIV